MIQDGSEVRTEVFTALLGDVSNYIKIKKSEKVVGVIPAHPNCFEITESEGASTLGYEFPGATNPDWCVMAERARKRRARNE
ncbi:hypothetical protein DSOL_5146 [Desulfosporosinus metallidurans]|uniref:Uncharacterized protein n=1 Tax=Desulfosporosinus metallidurans TaxID=1888891 RepID=A0A1Q8QFD7_9FIRM|nr:hypothetical protein DSOL_5146 [Desulfosporosinus metallidurans]